MNPRYLTACPFCFAEGGCKLGFTKKGMPYLACRLCQTRAFLNSREALRGVATTPQMIASLVARLAENDPNAQWARDRITELNTYVSNMMSGNAMPAVGNAPVPFVDRADVEEKIA